MSNGDDVLDNWEEIDEAGINDKLQRIQAERKTQTNSNTSTISSIPQKTSLTTSSETTTSVKSINTDYKPMKVLQRTPTQESGSTISSGNGGTTIQSPLDDMAATFQPVMMVLHKPNDEYQSANYTPPIKSQTVKILRRPTQNAEQRNNDPRPRQPIKTLQQREQEYAKARLRILGSAKNPEDEASTTNANNAQTTTTVSSTITPPQVNAKMNSSPKLPQQQQIPQMGSHMTNLYNNHYTPFAPHQQQPSLLAQSQFQQNFYYQPLPTQQSLHSHPSPNTSPAYNNRTLPLQQTSWSPVVGGSVSSNAIRHTQNNDNVLRLPRGPDGSTGFQMRR